LSAEVTIRPFQEENDVSQVRELFIIVDGNGYLRQLDLTEPECVVEPSGRQKAAELRQRFNHMWDRSEPAAGLNTAGLMA